MSVEERLARLETRADGHEKWLESIDGTLKQLVALASEGKGALRTFWKIGAIVAGVVTVATTLYSVIAHRV